MVSAEQKIAHVLACLHAYAVCPYSWVSTLSLSLKSGGNDWRKVGGVKHCFLFWEVQVSLKAQYSFLLPETVHGVVGTWGFMWDFTE